VSPPSPTEYGVQNGAGLRCWHFVRLTAIAAGFLARRVTGPQYYIMGYYLTHFVERSWTQSIILGVPIWQFGEVFRWRQVTSLTTIGGRQSSLPFEHSDTRLRHRLLLFVPLSPHDRHHREVDQSTTAALGGVSSLGWKCSRSGAVPKRMVAVAAGATAALAGTAAQSRGALSRAVTSVADSGQGRGAWQKGAQTVPDGHTLFSVFAFPFRGRRGACALCVRVPRAPTGRPVHVRVDRRHRRRRWQECASSFGAAAG